MKSKSKRSKTYSWSPYAKIYRPIEIGSIDGTDTEPHDRALLRAMATKYYQNRRVVTKPEHTIFVSRLHPKTTYQTIHDFFIQYGPIQSLRLILDIVTGTSKGYAFVEYENESDAEEAYQNAYNSVIDGCTIFVDFECERLLKGWIPRRLGGGFGGNKKSGQLRFGCRERPFKKPTYLESPEKKSKDNKKKKRRKSKDKR